MPIRGPGPKVDETLSVSHKYPLACSFIFRRLVVQSRRFSSCFSICDLNKCRSESFLIEKQKVPQRVPCPRRFVDSGSPLQPIDRRHLARWSFHRPAIRSGLRTHLQEVCRIKVIFNFIIMIGHYWSGVFHRVPNLLEAVLP